MAISLTECKYSMLPLKDDFPLAPLNEPYPKKECRAVPKRNNNMNYSEVDMKVTERTETVDQRQYLEERAYYIKDAKQRQFAKDYGIVAPDGPKTPAEFAQRIKDGAYTLVDLDKNPDKEFYSWRDILSWRTKPADEKGHKIAMETLNKQYTDLMDVIKIKTPEAGLAALQAFETWTV